VPVSAALLQSFASLEGEGEEKEEGTSPGAWSCTLRYLKFFDPQRKKRRG